MNAHFRLGWPTKWNVLSRPAMPGAEAHPAEPPPDRDEPCACERGLSRRESLEEQLEEAQREIGRLEDEIRAILCHRFLC